MMSASGAGAVANVVKAAAVAAAAAAAAAASAFAILGGGRFLTTMVVDESFLRFIVPVASVVESVAVDAAADVLADAVAVGEGSSLAGSSYTLSLTNAALHCLVGDVPSFLGGVSLVLDDAGGSIEQLERSPVSSVVLSTSTPR